MFAIKMTTCKDNNVFLISSDLTHWNRFSLEILCGSRHHRVPIRRPGSRSLPGDAAHPVWHHDRGPCPLPEEVFAGKVCFSGGAGVWHPLLDVLHSPWSHREVIKTHCD